MHIVILPLLGLIFTAHLHCVEPNLSLDFKVTKISASQANCNVANTTYAHGETFKLDCKTQCVCENGRHACSSLCPKEQLPAPEDTISCRSPRLVEVPGHCCKMWLCENPTADVYATCHNSSTSPWTPCSQPCGLGISTRFTATTAGCNQLINLRLCENRKCKATSELDNYTNSGHNNKINNDKLPNKSVQYSLEEADVFTMGHLKNHRHFHKHQEHRKQEIKKGHECRHIERLGPARIRLGQCVSRKLYRPKLCGHCYHQKKCCVPSLSTTIQVELLCPLNAGDPISFLQQQQVKTPASKHHQELYSASSQTSLWDVHYLDGIDQEYFQSHQIHIENKFIAIEWILKCTCSENESCSRGNISNISPDGGFNGNKEKGNFNNVNENNDNNKYKGETSNNDYNYFGPYSKKHKNNYKIQHLQHIDESAADDNGGDTVINRNIDHNKETKHTNDISVNYEEETKQWPTSALSSPTLSASSGEIQPDIIPYPPPPFTANKEENIYNKKHSGYNNKDREQQKEAANTLVEKLQTERAQKQAQQQQYFYEQWLLQQQQQERQQSLFKQLLST